MSSKILVRGPRKNLQILKLGLGGGGEVLVFVNS